MPTLTEEKVFDIARDNALIQAGTHFYCWGHLTARPVEEQSPDPRYCRSCCAFLLQEAEDTGGHARKAAWVPKVGKGRGTRFSAAPREGGGQAERIMSTVTAPKTMTDIITPVVAVKTRRGPKQKVLPVEDIKRWAGEEGIGSKLIAARLEKERGIKVSYKTVQRILTGKRANENMEVKSQ